MTAVTTAWRLYYDSGRTFGSDDGAWSDAPSEGVLVAVERRGTEVKIHIGADHYQLEEDGTITMRDDRTLLHAIGVVPMSSVKFGRMTSQTKFERAIEAARRDWL